VSARAVAALAKVAVTVFAAVMVSLQLVLPRQAPDQPVKTEPVEGAADNRTVTPLLKVFLQLPAQPDALPPGANEIRPWPAPAFM
jgi:hypothetical protein